MQFILVSKRAQSRNLQCDDKNEPEESKFNSSFKRLQSGCVVSVLTLGLSLLQENINLPAQWAIINVNTILRMTEVTKSSGCFVDMVAQQSYICPALTFLHRLCINYLYFFNVKC